VRWNAADARDSGTDREGRRSEPAAPKLQAPADELLALQRTAGNRAVAGTLARAPERTLARFDSLLEQGALAIAGGGVSLAAAAYLKQSVAYRNASEYVSELDKDGHNVGIHLGPCDALRTARGRGS
jgi:hypothetical protein